MSTLVWHERQVLGRLMGWVCAVAIPALREIRILPDGQAPVLLVDLGLVLVAHAAIHGRARVFVRILRFEIQVLHVDRVVARIALLVAVDGFGQQLVRRSAPLFVGLSIVAIGACLGRGLALGPAGLLGAGAEGGGRQGQGRQDRGDQATSHRLFSLASDGQPGRLDTGAYSPSSRLAIAK
jgi:hypothetical protein